MSRLTFVDYLRIVSEDTSAEVEKLRADISLIDATIASRTNPLMQQKLRLQKLLAQKEKQLQSEMKSKGQSDMQQQPGQPQGNQATTPGSSGASTPGQQ